VDRARTAKQYFWAIGDLRVNEFHSDYGLLYFGLSLFANHKELTRR